MKLTILSGGSGNDSLIKGLNKLCKDIEVKVVVNAYDNGKSTGLCRKITDTLGVSDIRKNHYRMYSTTTQNLDRGLVEFYTGRYDFDEDTVKEEVLNRIKIWGLDEYWRSSYGIDKLSEYAKRFFNNPKSNCDEYKDFNIANLVYSQMYKEIGYEKTNAVFCDILGIQDFVILNSFDNVYLKAKLNTGEIIHDEGELVNLASHDKWVEDTFYAIENTPEKDYTKPVPTLNPKAIEAILNCDYLVISTGTFYSSLYPTLQYGDMYKYINQSKAKKAWVYNNKPDKDSYANSWMFVNQAKHLGLNTDEFNILLNSSAKKQVSPEDAKHYKSYVMGDNEGKHDGFLYAKALMNNYYDDILSQPYGTYLLDFDDTIWSRDAETNLEALAVSKENVQLLRRIGEERITIISGNCYDTISSKLSKTIDLQSNLFKILTCAELEYHRQDKVMYELDDYSISKDMIKLIMSSIFSHCKDIPVLTFRQHTTEDIVSIKLKPIYKDRQPIVDKINEDLKNTDFRAKIAGKTTIDITHIENCKSLLVPYSWPSEKTLFIGDEIEDGNDKEIAKKCTHYISVKNIYETNLILKLIREAQIDELMENTWSD